VHHHVVEKLIVRDGGSFKLAPSLVAFENLKLMKANDACIRDPKRVRGVGRGIGEASNRIVQMLGLDKNSYQPSPDPSLTGYHYY